jgi:hypothetical protein
MAFASTLGARAIVGIETLERPSRGDAKKQKRDRRTDQDNGGDNQLLHGYFAAEHFHSEKDKPPHGPGGGRQNPKAEHSAAPVEWNLLLLLEVQTAALHGVHSDLGFHFPKFVIKARECKSAA